MTRNHILSIAALALADRRAGGVRQRLELVLDGGSTAGATSTASTDRARPLRAAAARAAP